MTNFAKKLLGIIILVAVAIGLYFYFTRPSSAPTVPADEAAAPLTNTAPESKTYAIVSEESTAQFTLNEDLRGKPTKVVGVTHDIGGSFSVIQNPAALTIGEIKVNARTLKTDNDQRNGAIGRMILKSEDPANEFVVFKPASVTGLPATIETGVEFPFSVIGDLTIKGITKPVTFTGTGTVNADGSFTGGAKTIVTHSDYDISIPNLPFLANVDKQTELSVAVVAR